jgi:hypothetical protein
VCNEDVAYPQRYRDLAVLVCSCLSTCLRPGLVEDDAANVIPRTILTVRSPVAAPRLVVVGLVNPASKLQLLRNYVYI